MRMDGKDFLNCYLAVTSLFAVGVLFRYPRLWALCLAVLTAAAILILFPFVWGFLHEPSSEFDGFLEFAYFLPILFVLGPIHLGLVLIVLGSVIKGRKRGAKL
jgi:putative flippase GtrA